MGNAVMDVKPFVIELVGPAGAGKTSLADELVIRSMSFRTIKPPYFRSLVDLPFFTTNLVTFLPVLSRMMLDAKRRNPSPRQVVWMLTLQGWNKRLRESRTDTNQIILLDQGPVFIMTDLYRMRCINLQDRLVKAWWAGVIGNWAETLDGVILLDAPNKNLIARIRSRRKWHLMKDRSDGDLINFLEDYRLWFERVLAQLTAKNRALRVLRLNSEKLSLSDMTARITAELGTIPNEVTLLQTNNSKQSFLRI